MPKSFAFLRAINVGGHNVTMEKLRAHFEALGVAQVETFIASGNVIFSSPSRNSKGLEGRIEKHLEKALGYEVRTFLRSGAELAAVAEYRPFSETELRSAGALLVGFLAKPLEPAVVRAVEKLETAVDTFHVHDREVYWLCRTGQGESLVGNVLLERTLQARATFRNMNTVARLVKKYELTEGPG
jgi:uncharacterized protein (DUF1697 family)